PQLLSAETAAEMREPLALADMPGEPWVSAYGLGIALSNVGGVRSFGHHGSMPGFVAVLRILADSGDALVIMANATSGLAPGLDDDLLEIVAEHEPISPETWRSAPTGVHPELLDITGTWYWGTTGLVLSLGADALLHLDALRPGLGREGSFEPVDSGTFVGLSGYFTGETLQIVRRRDASISHLDIGSFILSRSPYDPTAGIPGGVSETGWQNITTGGDSPKTS
ncbi:MAG: DUF7586 domain-containing protein, partial [Acidimicrobiales bacterium]